MATPTEVLPESEVRTDTIRNGLRVIAVRATHIPSGESCTATEGRGERRLRIAALRELAVLVLGEGAVPELGGPQPPPHLFDIPEHLEPAAQHATARLHSRRHRAGTAGTCGECRQDVELIASVLLA